MLNTQTITPLEANPSRCADSIVVIIKLEGEEARRFEEYRGDMCPRDVVRELVFDGITRFEQRHREIEEEVSQ